MWVCGAVSNPYLKKVLAQPAYSARGIKLKVDWHDVWIGVFWKRSRWPWLSSEAQGWRIDLFVCLVPCLPIRVWWTWE
jgi:hypothetical protein